MPSLRPTLVRLSAVPLLAALASLGACGDLPASSDITATAAPDTTALDTATTVPGATNTPAVSLPTELPTELVITDLTPGTGASAAVGDTVIVHYVGVRSADGQEFDSNFDGVPFAVTLGTTSVIQGWQQGLVGIQGGGRRQLDIPADLAYGDSPQGDVIQAGDALTFVIDALVVLPASKAEDEPKLTIEPAENVAQLTSTELIDGDGAVLQDGQNVAVHIISYRADTGERLGSDWGSTPVTFLFSTTSTVYPGLLSAVDGMHIGGRRQAQIPFSEIFEGAGNANLGLPASIDLVVVIDLIAVY